MENSQLIYVSIFRCPPQRGSAHTSHLLFVCVDAIFVSSSRCTGSCPCEYISPSDPAMGQILLSILHSLLEVSHLKSAVIISFSLASHCLLSLHHSFPDSTSRYQDALVSVHQHRCSLRLMCHQCAKTAGVL